MEISLRYSQTKFETIIFVTVNVLQNGGRLKIGVAKIIRFGSVGIVVIVGLTGTDKAAPPVCAIPILANRAVLQMVTIFQFIISNLIICSLIIEKLTVSKI